MLSGSSAASHLAIPDDSLFRMVPTVEKHAPFMTSYVEQDYDKTHAVVVVRNDLWGQDISSAFADHYDGTISATITYSPSIGTVNFAALVQQVEGAVDALGAVPTDNIVVMFFGFDADFVELAKAVRSDSSAATVDWYGAEGIVGMDRITQDPDAAAFAASVNLVGSAFNPRGHEISALDYRLMVAYPELEINTFTHTTYDAVHMLGDSVLSSFVEERSVKDLLREVANGHIEDPLHTLRDTQHELGVGITGDFELDVNGDLESPLHYDLYGVTMASDGSYEWTLLSTGHSDDLYSEGKSRYACR